MDVYRVNLFKKELRRILGAPWLRFYFSKDGCHICLEKRDIGEENVETMVQILKRNCIDFKVCRWSETTDFFGDIVRSINIPIDQEGLPERKQKRRFSRIVPQPPKEDAQD